MFKKDINNKLPIILILVLLLSFYFSTIFSSPLEQLRDFFVVDHYAISAFFYILFISLSVLLYPITILPAIPFFSKVFGSTDTFVFTLAGMLLGTLVSFYIARYTNDSFLNRFFPQRRIESMTKRFSKNLSFTEVFFFKLSSPPKGFSYFVGKFTKLDGWKYFIASFLGILPITYTMSFSADAIVHKEEDNILFFILLCSIFLVLLSHFFSQRMFKKNKSKIISRSDAFSLATVFSIATIELFLEKRGHVHELILTTDDDEINFYKKEKKEGKEIFVVGAGWEFDQEYDFFDKEKGDLQNDMKHGNTIFNLVWEKYGEKLVGSEKVTQKMKESLVENISFFERSTTRDLNKYEKERMDLQYIVKSFNTNPENEEERGENFGEAIDWAKNFIQSEVERNNKVD